MKSLFDGVFDIDSVVVKGKNHEDDSLIHSLTVKLSGTLDRDDVAFLFGVMHDKKKGSFKPVADLVPGLWTSDGKPNDAEAVFKPSSKYEGCTITVFEKLGESPAKNQIVGSFKDCELKSFVLHPNFGNTFNFAFAFFTTDIDQNMGEDIGRMSVHTKREVFVKVERKDDLFDLPAAD